MYIKITEQNVQLLIPGVTVVKYPLFGDPADEVDDMKENQLSDFIVDTVSREENSIVLNVPQHGGEIALMPVVIHPLHKELTELVAEQIWWIKE